MSNNIFKIDRTVNFAISKVIYLISFLDNHIKKYDVKKYLSQRKKVIKKCYFI